MSKLDEDKLRDNILAFLTLIQMPVAILYQAFILIKIWDWLVFSFIPIHLTYTLCVGLDLILGIVLLKPIEPKGIDNLDRFKHILLVNYIIPTVGLLIAFITYLITNSYK